MNNYELMQALEGTSFHIINCINKIHELNTLKAKAVATHYKSSRQYANEIALLYDERIKREHVRLVLLGTTWEQEDEKRQLIGKRYRGNRNAVSNRSNKTQTD